MFIGVPKEIKADEYRVGLIPSTIRELAARGDSIGVETLAGDGAGISDAEFAASGAKIVATADQRHCHGLPLRRSTSGAYSPQ
jgi:alanine dehydrogenase